MAANEKLMGDLHNALAAEFLKRVKCGEATAADLSAAAKFLKDNHIECTPEANPNLKFLADALPVFTDEQSGEAA